MALSLPCFSVYVVVYILHVFVYVPLVTLLSVNLLLESYYCHF